MSLFATILELEVRVNRSFHKVPECDDPSTFRGRCFIRFGLTKFPGPAARVPGSSVQPELFITAGDALRTEVILIGGLPSIRFGSLRRTARANGVSGFARSRRSRDRHHAVG